ncbi:MAG: hypothetical protein Q8P02_05425, partial [Candidatus Micrarchaeota archaeon]|nr:hypothetical protein [Candidatus Micrarchaeota archaeon]
MTRRLVLALLFLAPFAFAAGPFSTGQSAHFSLDFDAGSGNYSSIFAYFPDNWTSPDTGDFVCPADWIRDADTQKKAHCACAAPCQNLLETAQILLNTTAPAAGEYTFRLFAYGSDGTLLARKNQSVTVQTPADVTLVGDVAPVLPSGLPVQLNLTLQNTGQAGLSGVHIQIQSGLDEGRAEIGSVDVPGIF